MKHIIILVALVLLVSCSPATQERPSEQLSEQLPEQSPEEPAQAEIKTCPSDVESEVCGLVDNGIRCVTAPCASTDAIDFESADAACSADALGFYEGSCEEQTFVICKETFTGFDAKEFADSVGGVCVDICPGNYDPYMTQIGVEMCIKHYGVEEIESLPVCERSSETCECVRTYETTRGEEIADAQYRCVPEQYAERMLFRAGTDRLDEQGERSVMIA